MQIVPTIHAVRVKFATLLIQATHCADGVSLRAFIVGLISGLRARDDVSYVLFIS